MHEVLRSPGQPLDPATRAFFEPRFGHDFSRVRIHSDARAAESAQAVNALAYTVGRDVVFAPGQYSLGLTASRQLLAHELTHVVQQGGDFASGHQGLQMNTPGDAGEREADKAAETVEHHPRSLMNGGVGRQAVLQRKCGKALGSPTADCTPTTKDSPGEVFYFDVNCDDLKPDEPKHIERFVSLLPKGATLKIHGYASEEGPEAFNLNLSCHRANKMDSELRASAPDFPILGTFKHGATPGVPRAYWRSVVVETITAEPKPEKKPEPTPVPKRCGADVTEWLIDQMNVNQDHPVIKTGREHRWPRWVPVFNIGWTAGAMYDFAQLVGPSKPWDFKRTQEWWRAGSGRACPTTDCDRTVTLCGHCVNYDVPGNIHFGWVGRRMEIAPWALHAGAGSVQEGGAAGDDPPDTVAINIGIGMVDEGKYLCDEVIAKINQLNLDKTKGCEACTK